MSAVPPAFPTLVKANKPTARKTNRSTAQVCLNLTFNIIIFLRYRFHRAKFGRSVGKVIL
jgi:hypothetical protein